MNGMEWNEMEQVVTQLMEINMRDTGLKRSFVFGE